MLVTADAFRRLLRVCIVVSAGSSFSFVFSFWHTGSAFIAPLEGDTGSLACKVEKYIVSTFQRYKLVAPLRVKLKFQKKYRRNCLSFKNWYLLGNVLHTSLVAHTDGAYPGFCSMKRLGVLLLLLDGMLVHRRLPPVFSSGFS